MATKASSRSLYPLFYGGFHSLTDEGVGAYIEDKYNTAVRRMAWWTYDGLWSAAASGIGKGIVTAVLLTLAVATLGGAFLWHASVASPPLTEGLVDGARAGVRLLMSQLGLGIVGVGAGLGAVHDVTERQRSVRAELAATRTMVRDLRKALKEQELTRANEVLQQQANGHEPHVPGDFWQNREEDRGTSPGEKER